MPQLACHSEVHTPGTPVPLPEPTPSSASVVECQSLPWVELAEAFMKDEFKVRHSLLLR